MDLKKTILICAVVCLFCCVSPALAESPSHISMNVGTFTLLSQNSEYGIMALPITATISQGQTKSYPYFIPENVGLLEVTLEWNRGSLDNDLSLKMSDTRTSYGYFYDSYDGRINGVIPVATTSFKKGCLWTFDVYGNDVSGTQVFSLTINAI